MRKVIFSLLAATVSAFAMLQGAIMSPEQRSKHLDEIADLLNNEVRPIESELLAVAPSPFIPSLGKDVESEVEKAAVVLSDEELLEALSHKINPTGIFLFGGEFYLIFKEKKMKVGSELGIVYKDTEYSVTISAITGSNYVVRYGEAEMQLKLK